MKGVSFMSVKRRSGNQYHYRFKYKNKTYTGNTHEKDEVKAKVVEKRLKAELVVRLSGDDLALADLRQKVIQGRQGTSILLSDVWVTFKKDGPHQMSRPPGEAKWKFKENCWRDFLAYLTAEQPGYKTLLDVVDEDASDYIARLKTEGKFNKIVQGRGKSYKVNLKLLAPSTINEYIIQLKQVFDILRKKAGLQANPFDHIPKIRNKKTTRDVFELGELQRMYECISEGRIWAKSKSPKLDMLINKALLLIGLNTGLRRGDISLLKWEDINTSKNAIDTEMSKTELRVFIPISSPLADYFAEQRAKDPLTGYEEYVSPELAAMYLENPSGVSYRFKKLLQHLKINSTRDVKDRSRNISSKDIHSLRHTFCYLHGLHGTPMRTLQSMTGHLTAKMTEAYMLHETEQSKRKAIETIERLAIMDTDEHPGDSALLGQIKDLVKKLKDTPRRQRILEAIS
jgi:integrase